MDIRDEQKIPDELEAEAYSPRKDKTYNNQQVPPRKRGRPVKESGGTNLPRESFADWVKRMGAPAE